MDVTETTHAALIVLGSKKNVRKAALAVICITGLTIDEFPYIKIQPKTIDLNTTLWGINPTNSAFIPQSLAPRSIVLG